MADAVKPSIFSRLDTSLMRSTKSVSPSGTQERGKPGTQEVGKRANYPQQTFNMHPDVIDMLEDLKRDLRRRYTLKTSKEILAEEAIRLLCVDFQQKKDDSQIVHILKKTPGTQEDGNPGNQ